MAVTRTATTLGMIALGFAAWGSTGGPADAAMRYAGQLAATPQSPACRTELQPFGISFEDGLYAPNGSMAVVNTGGVCALNVTFFYGRPAGLVVMQAPQHGNLTLGDIQNGSSLNYRPAGGYTGADMFSVRAEVGGRYWTIPVAVTVSG